MGAFLSTPLRLFASSPPPPTDSFIPPEIPSSLLSSLKSSLPSLVLHLPSSPEYESNRVTFNKDVTGHPSLIIQPSSKEELKGCLSILGEFYSTLKQQRQTSPPPSTGSSEGPSELSAFPLCISGGRHSHLCMVNGSIVLDMQKMKSIHIDVAAMTVKADAGVKLGELDAELSKHELAVPVGTNIDTGIVGLTVGGGFGFLTRRYGLSIDSLLSAEIVLSSGEIVEATANNEHSDLFWAIRGGGGNFGVIASLTFRTYKRGKTVHGGNIYLFRKKNIFGFQGIDVFVKRWMEYTKSNPNDEMSFVGFNCGGYVVAFFAYIGDDVDEGKKRIPQWRELCPPTVSFIFPLPYSNHKHSLQQMALPSQDSAYYYEAGLILKQLPYEAYEILLKYSAENIPNKDSSLVLFQIGGHMGSIAKEDTAFFRRDGQYWLLIFGKWRRPDEAMKQKVRKWVRDIVADLKPWICGEYNTLGEGGLMEGKKDEGKDSKTSELSADESKVKDETANSHGGDTHPRSDFFYGENIARLRKVKRRYDPDNVFRLNKNIQPE